MFLALMLPVSGVWATKIHQCEDQFGNLSYQKHCPPDSVSVSSKEYSTRTATVEKELPGLVLYAIPECEVCDQMREHLSTSNLEVTEKNIKDNGELQQELKSKTGGDMRVPVLLIGDKVVAGYNQENLSAALKEAGYEVAEMERESKAETETTTAQAEP